MKLILKYNVSSLTFTVKIFFANIKLNQTLQYLHFYFQWGIVQDSKLVFLHNSVKAVLKISVGQQKQLFTSKVLPISIDLLSWMCISVIKTYSYIKVNNFLILNIYSTSIASKCIHENIKATMGVFNTFPICSQNKKLNNFFCNFTTEISIFKVF